MNVTLNQLRVFREVARHGHFTRAAETLCVSQPAVSKTIKDLERQIGEPLFEAMGRRVQLTEIGRRLLPYSERILIDLDDAGRAMAAERKGDRGRLVIGASNTPGTYLLPRVLGEYHRRHPGVELSLKISDTGDVLDAVTAGRLDLGVVGETSFAPAIRAERVRNDRLLLILAPGHHLSRKATIELDDLEGELFALREPGSSTRGVLEAALRKHGLAPRICMELGNTEAVKKLVGTGLCIGFVSEHELELEQRYGVLETRSVRGLDLDRGIYLIRREGFQPAALHRRFMTALQESYP